MEIKRILLVEPMKGSKHNNLIIREGSCVTSGSPIVLREPIAIEYLGGYLKNKGYEVIIIQQGNLSDEQMVDKIIECKPDVVGMSVHATYIHNYSLNIAKRIKKADDRIYIVFGGNHPTGNPYLLEDNNVDYVIMGEGEEVFYQLLLRLSDNGDVSDLKGIAWRDGSGKVMVNNVANRLDFSKIPWPLRNQEIISDCKCGPLCYPTPDRQTGAAQVSYSRGCSGGCEFCVSNYLWGKKLAYRRIEDVMAELKYLKDEYNVNFFYLTDLTFNSNKKKAMEFCNAMIESGLNLSWFAYCNVHLDKELAELMKAAGCTRIGFGLESVVDSGLEKIKPNQNFDAMAETLKITSDLGIFNRCYLMIGFPWETEEYIEKTKEAIKHLYIDQIRVGFVVPFPGTKIFDDWEDIRDKDLSKYTGDMPVVKNNNISPKRYLEIRDNMFEEFYGNKAYWERCEKKIHRHQYLKESYEYFSKYLKDNRVISG